MNWEEAYHKFDPMEPLKHDDCRLSLGLFGNFLDTVAEHLLLNRDKNQKLLLSGHKGCGKSTFLNLLKERDDIKNNFFTVKYSINDVLDQNDTNHIDLLLSLTLQTFIAVQEGEEVKIDEELHKKLKELAGELQGLIERKEETIKKRKRGIGAGIKAGMGLASLIPWFKTEFFARYQIENETRESVRKYYKPRMTDFLNTINDLLLRIQAHLNKTLLILIDDTDKIFPLERALEIFSDNGQYLAKPPANIVFMVDTAVSCSSKYSTIRTNIGEEEFFPAIKVIERDGSFSPTTDTNHEMLGKLVLKRMSEELIEEQALKKAIEMSGGVVRELIRILNQAIFHARGKVREDHVDYAIIKIRNSYNLFAEHVRILKAVFDNPNWFQTTAGEDNTKLEAPSLSFFICPHSFSIEMGRTSGIDLILYLFHGSRN